MAQLGADVEALEGMARRFNGAAQQLQSIVGELSGQVNGAWWQGSDADRFRSDWEGSYKSQLNQMCQRFDQTSTDITTQATQQRQVSQA